MEDALDPVIHDGIRAIDGVGVTVALQCGDGPVFVRGFGHSDLETESTADADTVYEIGSISKQYVAAEILRLEEAGHLSRYDEIGAYLDGLPEPWKGLTLEQLLTHTGGVPDHFAIFNADPATPFDWASDHTAAELIEEFVALDEDLASPPGTSFIYSSTGYVMLTAVIEAVTGQPFGVAMQEGLFAPLGLTATSFCAPDIAGLATGYNIGPDGPVRGPEVPAWFLSGAAGICSTAGDAVRWERSLVSGDIVEPGTFELMTTPAALEDGSYTAYGYGLNLGYLGGEWAIYHEGGTASFSSWLVYYPERDVIIAVLSNTLGPNAALIGDLVIDLAEASRSPLGQ